MTKKLKEVNNLEEESKMIVFDVDGVLIDEKRGGFKDILVILGKEKEVRDIDKEYQRRKHKGPWGLEQLAQLYKGLSKDKLVETAREYCSNLMKGAQETISELKKRFKVGALSSNPQFVMDCLKETLDLDFAHGCRLEYKNGKATGKLAKKVDRNVKAEILREKKKEYSILKENVIVVGDSITDIPMKKEGGLFIGFNAKEEIRDELDVKVEGKDLGGVLKHI